MTYYDPKYAIRNALRQAYSEPLGAASARMHDLAHHLTLLLQAREAAGDETSVCARPH